MISKKYDKIFNKIKNKKVIIYGAGKFFQNLDFDFSKLNIVGIADKKFLASELGKEFSGFKIIPYEYLNHNDADVILIALENPKGAYCELKQFIPKNKLLSLVKIPSYIYIYIFKNFFTKILKKFQKNNNEFILVKKDGKEIRNPKIKNLKIEMQGNNSLVKVYEPLTIRDKVVIRCNSNSTIIINGCNVFRKAKILIGPNSKLIIGKNTTVENASFILKNVENTKITIGDDCMISFNVIIRTGDGHTIYDCETLEVLNKPKDIYIGNHVWIAANITILKGSHIPSNCVIGTGSVVNKEFNEENCIIAGVPAKIVKNNINWDRCTVQNFQKLCMHSIKK